MAAAGDADEVVYESIGICIYKSGRVRRDFGSEFTPATVDSSTGVASCDAVISTDPAISARLYLPAVNPAGRLPVFVYYHGGGFCLGSAFNPIFHSYFNSFVSLAGVLVVSVEYRLAPEHPVPAAHSDSWVALKWVLSSAHPWLADFGDFSRLFVGGESAGANIAHHIALRPDVPDDAIAGLVLIHPYFLGSNRVDSDDIDPAACESLQSLWKIMCPQTTGVDDPLINPFVAGAQPLSRLACRRALICIAGNDVLKDRGKAYYEQLKSCGWHGEVEIWEAAGDGHTFHLLEPTCDTALQQDRVIAEFLNRQLQ